MLSMSVELEGAVIGPKDAKHHQKFPDSEVGLIEVLTYMSLGLLKRSVYDML